MKKKWNVLVFPAGMENGLEIWESLRHCKEVQLFGASSPIMNQAFYVYKNVQIVRDVREDGWITDLNKAIRACQIDLVFPANSIVIDHLSLARDQIEAPILLPDHAIIALTRSKKKTLQILAPYIPTPRCYQSAEEIESFPVFAKPDRGFGAQGASLIEARAQAQEIDFDAFVVQEHLPGKEYTVDCFSDAQGHLLFSGARERSRIRMATSMHAESVDPALEAKTAHYAKEILKRIKIPGAWFFQLKEDASGELRLLEIDIRIAGTMGFNRARGINFPLLSIFQFIGRSVGTMINKAPLSLDRCLKNRFFFNYEYDTVYVDLDDTLIVHEKINTQLVQFLYQCINGKKKIILLTKHLGPDVKAYLKEKRLFQIFDEIVWIKEGDSKAKLITNKTNAIYIDDSFSQRREVAETCGLPTFDPSMIEALLDDRI